MLSMLGLGNEKLPDELFMLKGIKE